MVDFPLLAPSVPEHVKHGRTFNALGALSRLVSCARIVFGVISHWNCSRKNNPLKETTQNA
jgi:hypothetical protein